MTDEAQKLSRLLAELAAALPTLRHLSDEDFDVVRTHWLTASEAMKDALFTPNPKQLKPDRKKFEFAQGAQSAQFMIDLLPHLHRLMRTHYDRFDRLRLLDVGAGSGAGSQLLTQLHSDVLLWSRLDVTAIDHVPWRQRWVAMLYPCIDYRVMASSELPAREWDFVVCSHVIEHLSDPRAMISDVIRACRGFALIYAPYKELELSPGHLSVITEETFASFEPSELHIDTSMGFHGEGRRCILAIFDCRHRRAESTDAR